MLCPWVYPNRYDLCLTLVTPSDIVHLAMMSSVNNLDSTGELLEGPPPATRSSHPVESFLFAKKAQAI